MGTTLGNLLERIEQDPFRQGTPLTPWTGAATQALLAAQDDAERERVLSEWLSQHQPCLFGRIAARKRYLRYCFLTDADLRGSESDVREKIQVARREWWRAGLAGEAHGFVVLAVSKTLAFARPSPTLAEFARRLCSLYLHEDVELDRIHHDRLFLDVPGRKAHKFMWLCGVNYFSTSGEGRWWADHTIPGGMALSVNSVGHMVKAHALDGHVRELERALVSVEPLTEPKKIDTLFRALLLAMDTIDGAAVTEWGPATRLLAAPDVRQLPVSAPPGKLPQKHAERNYCTYEGYYHTDVTLPACYFVEAAARPSDLPALALDLTYLFVDDVENTAHESMGKGVRLADRKRNRRLLDRLGATRMRPEVVRLSEHPELRGAMDEAQGDAESES